VSISANLQLQSHLLILQMLFISYCELKFPGVYYIFFFHPAEASDSLKHLTKQGLYIIKILFKRLQVLISASIDLDSYFNINFSVYRCLNVFISCIACLIRFVISKRNIISINWLFDKGLLYFSSILKKLKSLGFIIRPQLRIIFIYRQQIKERDLFGHIFFEKV